ncbi:hypothetical protein [Streptomyces apricus]|uniref:Uncharacterized protein n=1 Tax=Streptomyces apricus TaxID=1828112 RepID=A0A5B0AB28_9ACTN|nr:hypothetical protein [Streptomyces apricus]KAA0927037.1 hypothetical protein FGF04_31890 [Streptomyces apricus]
MITFLVLFVVLGLALLGAAVVLTRRRRGPSAAPAARTAGPGADRKVLDTVALGLQAVAEGRARSGRPLPDLHTVVHSGRRMTLQLAQADTAAPSPWTSDVSGKEWLLDPENLRRTGTGTGTGGDGPAHPYSLTVTLGLHRGDRVLVDLAQLPGTIALTGDDMEVLRLAQALISEIVSGPVGRLATVVLVGSATTPSVTDGVVTRSPRLRTAATREEALTHDENDKSDRNDGNGAMDRGKNADAAGTYGRRLFVVTAAQFRDERWADAPLRATDVLLVLGYITDAVWHLAVNTDGSLDTGRLGVPVDTHTARFAGPADL